MSPLEVLESLSGTTWAREDLPWVNHFMQSRFPGNYTVLVDNTDKKYRLYMEFESPSHQTHWLLKQNEYCRNNQE